MTEQSEAALEQPTVWRIVWENGGLEWASSWSIHYDMVRDYLDEYQTNMPGANVRMQAADVAKLENIRTMDFSPTEEPPDEERPMLPMEEPLDGE